MFVKGLVAIGVLEKSSSDLNVKNRLVRGLPTGYEFATGRVQLMRPNHSFERTAEDS